MRKPVLQVKWVKDTNPSSDTPDVKETEVEGKTAVIAYTFLRGLRLVVAAGGAYIILDTVRQVMVAQANNKV